jgi:membrane-bound metal-dependent hydrolase YbcI (DUF457 family)
MDTLSHALYGKGLFGYKKYKWASYFFGALPDLLSFGIFFIVQLFFNYASFDFGRPSIDQIPLWVYHLYDITHSLVTAFIFIGIAYLIDKNFAWVMLGWPIHIIVDFFTHSIEFFPTPILWPISDYRFDGIPWSNIYVLILNLILIFLIFRYRWKKINP